MEYIVVTELEIDGEKFNNFSSLTLQQAYHDHHKFVIKFRLGDDFMVTAADVDVFIGKPVLITYKKTIGPSSETAYEFHGFVLEAQFDRKGTTYPEFILIGYSNTIKLEDGYCKTFLDKSIENIVSEVIGNKIDYSFHAGTATSDVMPYSCQYEESDFHYLRGLSIYVGCNMHYDGKRLHFGDPGVNVIVDEATNYDLLSIKVNLKLSPQKFSSHAYNAGEDKLYVSKASSEVENFGKNASFLQTESNNFFSTQPTSASSSMNITSQKMLDDLVKMEQLAKAADLQNVSGTSHNPSIVIGRILRVLPPGGNYNDDDNDNNYESYLITKVDHFTEDGNKYANRFEGIPYVESKTFLLDNGSSVIDEKFEYSKSAPQIATVMDNNDPDNKGRVKVQMFWQQEKNETTNWIRVMTPDAGGGKDGAKNRGFVAIPEKGDQVMIDFEYNLPDYPFVMGGMFHGKSGGGGGGGNKIKSLTSLSGCTVSLDGSAINIIDAGGHYIKLSGTGDINIKSSDHITLECGDSSIKLTPGNIAIKSKRITIEGSTDAKMFSGEGSFLAQAGDVTMKGFNAKVEGTTTAKLDGLQTTVNGTTETTVKGATVKIN